MTTPALIPTAPIDSVPTSPLTCGHCNRAAATHVLIVYYAIPELGRRTEMVCLPCGEYSMRVSAPVCHSVQLYPVMFSQPEQALEAQP